MANNTATPPTSGAAPIDLTRWPSAATTGVPAGTKLTPSVPLVVMEEGLVFDGLDINGCVRITVRNVVIRNSRIRCADGQVGIWQTSTGGGLVVENTEIIGVSGGTGNLEAGVYSIRPMTVTNSDISGFTDGIFFGGWARIEDNWIHDLRVQRGRHNDAVQMVGGKGSIITGNHFDHAKAQTSAILIKSDDAPISDVRVEDNLVIGGGISLYVYAGQAFWGGCCGPPTNVTVTNNVFVRDSYTKAAATIQGSGTVSCNRYSDGELIEIHNNHDLDKMYVNGC